MSLTSFNHRLWHAAWNNIIAFDLQSPQTRNAIRGAAACTLAIWIALFLRADHPFWSGISAFVAMQGNIGATLQKSALRFSATILGAVVSLLLLKCFVETRPIMLATLFIAVTAGIYLSIVDRRYMYIWLLGYITMSMVAIAGMGNPTPNHFISLAFFRSFEVSIGILASIIVSPILFPVRAIDEVKRTLNALIPLFRTLQPIYLSELFSDVDHLKGAAYDTIQSFVKKLEQLDVLLGQAALERRYNAEIRQANQIAIGLRNWFSCYMQYLRFRRSHPKNAYAIHFIKAQSGLEALQACMLEYLETTLTQGRLTDQTKAQVEQELQSQWQSFEAHYIQLRGQKLYQQYSTEEVDVFLYGVAALFSGYRALFIEPPRSLKKIKKVATPSWIQRIFHYDWLQLKFSLIGATAILVAPLIWLGLALPGFQQIAISIGAVIGISPDASRYKGYLRFTGCLVGGLLGVLLLGLDIDNILIMLIFTFLGTAFFLYFHYGDSQVSYFGTQGACVFFIGFINELHPDLNTEVSWLRLTGILIGLASLFIMQYIFWPYKGQEVLHSNLKQLTRVLFPIINRVKQYRLDDGAISIDQELEELRAEIHNHEPWTEKSDFQVDSEALFELSTLLCHSLATLQVRVQYLHNPHVTAQTIPQFSSWIAQVLDPILNEAMIDTAEILAVKHEIQAHRQDLRKQMITDKMTTIIAFQVLMVIRLLLTLCECAEEWVHFRNQVALSNEPTHIATANA